MPCFARHAYVHTFVRLDVDNNNSSSSNNNSEEHICPDCGLEFPGLEDSLDHGVCPAAPKPLFPCAVCAMTFTRKDNLRQHLRAHAGVAEEDKQQQNVYQ